MRAYELTITNSTNLHRFRSPSTNIGSICNLISSYTCNAVVCLLIEEIEEIIIFFHQKQCECTEAHLGPIKIFFLKFVITNF